MPLEHSRQSSLLMHRRGSRVCRGHRIQRCDCCRVVVGSPALFCGVFADQKRFTFSVAGVFFVKTLNRWVRVRRWQTDALSVCVVCVMLWACYRNGLHACVYGFDTVAVWLLSGYTVSRAKSRFTVDMFTVFVDAATFVGFFVTVTSRERWEDLPASLCLPFVCMFLNAGWYYCTCRQVMDVEESTAFSRLFSALNFLFCMPEAAGEVCYYTVHTPLSILYLQL